MQSSLLFLHACQFSLLADQTTNWAPKILAVQTKSWLGHSGPGRGGWRFCHVRPSCSEIFIGNTKFSCETAHLWVKILYVCLYISANRDANSKTEDIEQGKKWWWKSRNRAEQVQETEHFRIRSRTWTTSQEEFLKCDTFEVLMLV